MIIHREEPEWSNIVAPINKATPAVYRERPNIASAPDIVVRYPGRCFSRTIREESAEEKLHVIIDGADAGDAEVLDEDLRHVRREECGQCRSEMNVLHAEGQEGQ